MTDAYQPACGNATVDPGELCDDGPLNANTPNAPCRTDCTPRRCGDRIVDDGELCDDGPQNADDPDAPCRTNCTPRRCGDGIVDSGEVCDDGNLVGSDGCSASCSSDETCGNAVVDPQEACDEGALNSDAPDAACRTDCTPRRCGDDIVDADETCDDGNLVGGDGCSADCGSDETCGNGVVDPWEACDWGALNSDAPDAGCRTDCTPRRCGDGIIDADEVCDGSALGGLDCPALGMTGGPVSCASDCAVDVSRCDRCGDGVAGPSEVCDGSDLHGATCATVGFVSGVIRCTAACGLDPSGCGRCGDGSLDPGEACDDGDLASRDGCSSGCTAESLGWTRIPAAIPGGFQPSAMVGFPPLGGIVLVWGRNRELIPYASWVYDGERFERLPDEQVLPLAEGGRIVYDSGRNVLVSTTWANRVWEFDGATVVERALAQTPPSRNFSSLAYDSARGVTVLFGGCNDHFDTFHQDTWEYDGNYSETPPDHYELGFQPTWPDEDCQSDADLDADGLAGCADPDCEGRRCAGGVCTGGVCQ